MAILQIVKPSQDDNLAINPIFGGTTGYAAYGGATLTRTLASASTPTRWGWYSLRVQTAGTNRGATLTVKAMANAQHTFAIWVRGTFTQLQARAGAGAFANMMQAETDGDATRWYIQPSAGDCNAATTFDVIDTTTGADFYILGWMCIQATYLRTQFDGGMGDGFRWLGPAHGSASRCYAIIPGSNTPNTGHGRLYDLDSSTFLVTSMSGFGLPSVNNLAQDQALIPGKVYYSTAFNERALAIGFTLKASSMADLYSQRKVIESYIQTGDPFVLRYLDVDGTPGTTRTLEITCIYAGGLSLTVRSDMGWSETPAIALTALDPVFRQTGEAASYLTTYSATASSDTIFGRTDGAWARLGSGSPITACRDMNVGPDNKVYAAGGSIVASWDGNAATWGTVLTVRGGSALVHSLAWDLAGTALYVGGDFSTAVAWGAGTVAAANIVNYDYSGVAVRAMGSGVNAVCYEVHSSRDNNYILAGGAMTQANGTASVAMARWNKAGSYWQAFTTQPATGTVYAIESAANGDIWVAGNVPTFGTMAAIGAVTSGTAVGTTYWNAAGSATHQVVPYNLTGAGLPSAATTLRYINVANRVITLSWSAVTGATGYYIYREAATNGNTLETQFTYIASTTTNSYTDDGSVSDGSFTAYPGAQVPATATDGVRSVGIARYDSANAVWKTVGKPGGPGFAAGKIVYALRLASDQQSLYAGLASDNTTIDGATVAGVAFCKNGAVWYALSSGLTGGDVRVIGASPGSGVWFGGAFTAGGPSASTQLAKLARWVGQENGVWLPGDIVPGQTVMALAAQGQTTYLGELAADTPTVGAAATVTYSGTFMNWPRIEIMGPLVVTWIENLTTASRLYFTPTALTIAAGETVTIQLYPSKYGVTSSTRGLLRSALSGASDLATWRMRPGSNTIVIYGTGSTATTVVRIIDSVAHLSVDAGAA